MPSGRTKVLTVTRKDVNWETFRTGGAGGQHRDKTSNGARCVHPPSGARGESTEHRSQWKNKQAAFRRMGESPEFRSWVRLEHARAAGDIDAAVRHAMRPENIDIEFGPFD